MATRFGLVEGTEKSDTLPGAANAVLGNSLGGELLEGIEVGIPRARHREPLIPDS